MNLRLDLINSSEYFMTRDTGYDEMNIGLAFFIISVNSVEMFICPTYQINISRLFGGSFKSRRIFKVLHKTLNVTFKITHLKRQSIE